MDSTGMRAVLLISVSALLLASVAAAAGPTPPNAEQIAVATTGGRIVLVDTNGHRLATLSRRVAPGVLDWAPAWSPDGKWLAFTRSTDRWRSFHVFVMRADGTGVRQLTHGRYDESPAWSPDGRWIAYQTMGGIRIMHPDGRGSRLVRGTGLTHPHYTETYGTLPSWTPRGRLSYSFHPEVSTDWPASCRVALAHCGWVFVSDRDGRHRSPVLHGRDAHWSPTGEAIVFTPPDAASPSSQAATIGCSGAAIGPTGHPTAPTSSTPASAWPRPATRSGSWTRTGATRTGS
jgi:dipeptidyl aminopeptidase/acylaminoacyl peptidase